MYKNYMQAKRISQSFFERSYRRKVLVTWILYMDREQRKKENTRRALSLFRKGLLAKGFYSWRDRAKKLISDREKINRSLTTMRKNCKASYLEQWRAHVFRRRQKAKAVKHACRVIKRSGLKMWSVNAEFLKERRRKCERLQYRVVSRMKRTLLHKAIAAACCWRGHRKVRTSAPPCEASAAPAHTCRAGGGCTSCRCMLHTSLSHPSG